jgi:hypothetical protein
LLPDVNTSQLLTADNNRRLWLMIELDYDPDDAQNGVDVGSRLLVPERFGAHIEQDDFTYWSEDRASTIDLQVEWSHEKFSYEVSSISVNRGSGGGEGLTGTALRAIPIHQLLRICINRVVHVRVGDGGDERLHEIVLEDPHWLAPFAAKGPVPETLDWVARMYLMAKIKLDPPTQFVSKSFGIPHRTASHWIKLARQRGHINI